MKDYLTIHFPTATDFEQWLIENHAKEDGLWMECYKKHTGVPSVSFKEALDVALCYGWIDSLMKRVDDERYVRKYTPRKPKSRWSDNNKKHALRLMEEGRMTEAGLMTIPSYRESGKVVWEESEEAPITDAQINQFLFVLEKHPPALEHFENLPASQRLNYIGWIFQAKCEETRQKRMAEAVALLMEGKTLGMK